MREQEQRKGIGALDMPIMVGKTPVQSQALSSPLAFDPDKALSNFGDDREMLRDMLNVRPDPR